MTLRIGGVMVSILIASSVVDREPQLDRTKDYTIGICCFYDNHAALRSKSWIIQNQNNMAEWSDMSTHRLLFQWDSTIKI
jgi:hypothetical protein